MKRLYTLLFLLPFFTAIGQGYNFSTFTETYSEISGTEINVNDYDEDSWDDPGFAVDLGFSFEIGGETFTEVNQNGLGCEMGFTSLLYHLFGYGSDLIDGDIVEGEPGSIISYTTEGNSGNQICKIQFKDCAFYAEVTEQNSADNRVNFQIWLYEADNAIELRFGPNTITNSTLAHEGFPGPTIYLITGIDLETSEFEYGAGLTGNPQDPTPEEVTELQPSLDGEPENGRVYRFAPSALSSESVEEAPFLLYPVPAKDLLFIDGQEISGRTYRIADLSGRIVNSGLITESSIDVSSLTTGFYSLTIGNSKAVKFLKK